jgi:hypothetical protein
MIEIISETVCTLEVLKFEPFEPDLENAVIDPTVEKIMYFAFAEHEYLDSKFVLVGWDVGRPGLRYGIEKFGTRSQFNTMERTWPKNIGRGQCIITWNTISYDNVQGVGSKLYFQSFHSNRPYYCTILAMGSFDCCMSELKKYESLTLHYPLRDDDYLVSKDNLWMLQDSSREHSRRSEPIHFHLAVDKVMAEFELSEKK